MDVITVWSFNKAPEEYRKLSPHGGDEDFVVLSATEDVWDFKLGNLLDGITICDYSKHEVLVNDKKMFVYITSHA